MGDRISVQFENNGDKSVVFFHHWGGMEFLEKVKYYFEDLTLELQSKRRGQLYPIDRLEPDTVMVDFIRWFTKDCGRIESSLYLGRDESDGDNGDNGHHVFDLKKGEFVYPKEKEGEP